jgi:prevent-host-death family protein
MADVGVRELKQRLSEYLDRAERGELLRVTDRGRPKALLGPLPGRARVEEGTAEGWIKAGSGEGLRPVPRLGSTSRVLDVLAEDRGE